MIHFLGASFPCVDTENVTAFLNYIENETAFLIESMNAVPLKTKMKVHIPGQQSDLSVFLIYLSAEPQDFTEFFDLDSPIGNSMLIQQKMSETFGEWVKKYIEVVDAHQKA